MSARPVALACWLGAAAAVAGQSRSLTLADCYTQALASNQNIQIARADLQRASGTRIAFHSRAWPVLLLRVQAAAADGDLYNGFNTYMLPAANASMPLFDLGVPAALRRGNYEVAIARQRLQQTVTAQLHALRLAWLRALLFGEMQQLYRQIEDNARANWTRTRQRFDVGLVGRQAVAQAELQLHNLQPALSYVQRERKNALTELAVCLGAGQGAVPQVPGAIEYAPLRFDLALESARAVTNRPDLRLLRAIISAMAEDRESVRAGYFPLVSLVAMSQYAPETKALTARPEIVNGQDTRYTETRYGVAYTWQVIDNGRVTGASRRMAGNVAAVRITLQRLEENVPRELATLARTLETVEARYHALEQSRTQAEELLKLVETRLALGEATQLEHLNAQSNLLNVRAGQLMGTYDNEIARAEFDRLTGRYLDFSADAPASRNNTGTQGAAQNGP